MGSHDASADDWPQWLGPQRDAVWREEGILSEFPEGGPALRWQSPVGGGYSGPAVADGQVYVMDRIQADEIDSEGWAPFKRGTAAGKERILCLRESDGQPLWAHVYDCPYSIATAYATGPRATPAVADGLVYALGAEGNLHCLKASDGNVVWSCDFKRDYGLKIPVWGTSSHPLIDGDRLICVVGGEGSVAVAFDRRSGKEVWRSLSAQQPGYAPPVIAKIDGERQLLIWHSDALCALNPQTGDLLWSVGLKPKFTMAISTPQVVDRQVFVTGYQWQSWLINIGEDRRSAQIAWQGDRHRGIGGVFNTPFIEAGSIYGCNNDGDYTCARLADGEVLWQSPKPLHAERRIEWGNVFTVKHRDRFFLATDQGELIIARLDTEGYHETSRAQLIDPTHRVASRRVVWSHPAFANRSIYLRNDREIRCYALAASAEP
jgi:outer membrane protein assembly factor BamB